MTLHEITVMINAFVPVPLSPHTVLGLQLQFQCLVCGIEGHC